MPTLEQWENYARRRPNPLARPGVTGTPLDGVKEGVRNASNATRAGVGNAARAFGDWIAPETAAPSAAPPAATPVVTPAQRAKRFATDPANTPPARASTVFAKSPAVQDPAAQFVPASTIPLSALAGMTPPSSPPSDDPAARAARFATQQTVSGFTPINRVGEQEPPAPDTYVKTTPVATGSTSAGAFAAWRQGVLRQAQQDQADALERLAKLKFSNPQRETALAQYRAAQEGVNQAQQDLQAAGGPLELRTVNRMDGTASMVREAGGRVAGPMAAARTGQIFVGAKTDAEAQRNLQARAEQDEAARMVVAGINREADALREVRASRLGVSRGTLDQMEGRGDSEFARAQQAAQAQAQAQTAQPSSSGYWDRPGDRFGDAQMRAAKFTSLINDAANETGPGARRRAAMKFKAAEDMAAEGKSAMEQATAFHKAATDLEGDRVRARAQQFGEAEQTRRTQLDAQSNERLRQMQEAAAGQRTLWQQEGLERRAQLNADTQRATAKYAQIGGIERERLQQFATDQREGAKALADDFRAGGDYITQVTTGNGKGPPMVSQSDINQFLSQIDTPKTAQGLGLDPATVDRWKSGKWRLHEAQDLVGRVIQWRAARPSDWNPFGADPNAMDFMLPATR